MTDLTVIVVNWNTRDLLAECIRSIRQGVRDLDVEVIVVDNGSADGTVDMLREDFPWVRLIASAESAGLGRANDQALDQCDGGYLALLGSDTKVFTGSLEQLADFLDVHPRAGLAGLRLPNADRTFQASYSPFPTLGRESLVLSTLGRQLIRAPFPSHGPRLPEGP